ncbi:MAG: FAD-binding oxidoreductase [Dehalococcoidia bacterium]
MIEAKGANGQEIVRSLANLIGGHLVSGDPQELAAAAHDTLRRARASAGNLARMVQPLAVVRPQHTEDVVAVVCFAAQEGLAIVQLGGGTGLMGGARSIRAGIVLDMTSMQRILSIEPEDRTTRVQPGVVLDQLNNALEPLGLMLGHDPWTVPVATVGGTISTNSLGYRGARYGSMGDQVLGLEVVLGDGSILRTRPAARSSTGPQLRHLFIGAEGTLGVITEATLRVFPLPESRRLRAFEFPDFDSGFRAVESLFAINLVPAMVDYGQTYAGSRESPALFTPEGSPGRLQLAFEGFAEAVEAAERRATRICLQNSGAALPEAEAQEFWEDRHVVAERFRVRRAKDDHDSWLEGGVLFDFVHVALPASQVLSYRDRAAALMAGRGVSVIEWGLWNTPELFSAVVQRPVRDETEARTFAAAVDELLRLAQDLGGSMEYCHGAGLRLASLMEREHGRGLELLRAIKSAADPHGLMNPGKLNL